MIILDLFAGTGSSTAAFEAAGHQVYRVEIDPRHTADLHADVTALTRADVIELCGDVPDFIWASPPCTAFSVASIGYYWENGGAFPVPKHPKAVAAQEVVVATLRLIHDLAPNYWLMENPRGMLRKLPVVRGYARWTITYCQYGDSRMKPTDLWGVMPHYWAPRPACKNGDKCHLSAPRGSRTGTQGIAGAIDRSRVPYELSEEVCRAISGGLATEAQPSLWWRTTAGQETAS